MLLHTDVEIDVFAEVPGDSDESEDVDVDADIL